ncbi:hypothetical protein Patl1_19165 [Pistacia atlantica]|uniref:Uncharacterized protein n=1 Tax=Pistacia atlantica TaxID=434234 RepID=A0ACC1C0C6_9ROSI|nr:hypothetical protein Patl1_19165 [Pistacia atlantica]
MYCQLNRQFILLLHSIIIAIFCNLIVLPASFCHDDDRFVACSQSYSCGSTIQNIGYPFWGNTRHRPERIITIARDDLWHDFCPGIFTETNLGHALFHIVPKNVRYFLRLFYDCSGKISLLQNSSSFRCKVEGRERIAFYFSGQLLGEKLPNLTSICNNYIRVPVSRSSVDHLRAGEFGKALNKGFDVEYTARFCKPCESSGGMCGSNYSTSNPLIVSSTSNPFVCFCRDKPRPKSCASGNGSKLDLKFVIIEPN